MIRKIPHQAYYFFELAVLVAGFYIIFLLSYSFYLQAASLVLVLIFYTTLGILHHILHHDLYPKIVIEYVLVSLMILAVFVFLNTSKI